ncbi:hypothetical protein EMPS_02745 [Entomortierella parvispora]|uniref:Uncharacterized protein n=1 Tax=Entomortierella parvispora TaxID=205924 RepID=A0A9P3H5C4_9FUNG|nr:hypothetical protein EMPS_02745 [Entomortierella parvispora]
MALGSDEDADFDDVDDDETEDGDDDKTEDGDDDDTADFEDGDSDDDSFDSEHVPVKKHNKHKKGSHHGKKKKAKKGGKKEKHPWAGLCVGSGTLCGSNLSGCNFILSAVYTCSQQGDKPTFVKTCANGCNNGSCGGGDDKTIALLTSPPSVKPTAGPEIADRAPSGVPTAPPSVKPTVGLEIAVKAPSGVPTAPPSVKPTVGLEIAVKTPYGVPTGVPTDAPIVGPATTTGDNGIATGGPGSPVPTDGPLEPTSIAGDNGDRKTEGGDGGKSTPTGADPTRGPLVATPPVPPPTANPTTSNPQPTDPPVESTCVCKTNGKACGSSFPGVCNFAKDSLYTCTRGQAPSASQGCSNGCSNDACSVRPVDPCACKGTDDVCGSAFDKSCSKDANTLYQCPTKGGEPIKRKSCVEGCATREGQPDLCMEPGETDPCPCVNDQPFCTGPNPRCGRTPNSAYECAGKGSKPELKGKCGANALCHAEDHKGTCEIQPHENPCGCRYYKEMCGFDFQEECASALGGEIILGAVYHCPSGNNKSAEIKTRCGAESICTYASEDGSATCEPIDKVPKECLCTRDGDVCGSNWVYTCGWEETGLYQCKKGSVPLRKHQCLPAGCQPAPGGKDDICSPIPKKCLCFDNTTITQRCGSSFDFECYYDQNTVYECSAGPIPTKIQTCLYGCKRNAISGHSECVSDGVVSQGCRCPDEGLYCGNMLDKGCKADPMYLYDCSAGKDTKPMKVNQCSAGTACIFDPKEKTSRCLGVTPYDTCICPGKGTFCTADLDAERCSDLILQNGPNAVYDCTGDSMTPGKNTPKMTSICPSGSVCLSEDREASCGTPHCSCKADGKTFCSSDFSPACGLEKNSVYECSNKGKPKPVISCSSEQACVALDDGATCASTECACPSDGTICGKHFPAVCGFNSKALLSCVAGEKPSEDPDDIILCPGGCTSSIENLESDEGMSVEDVDDICLEDCSCKESSADVCGSSWSEGCGYDKNKLYHCSFQLLQPEAVKTCDKGCTVNVGSDTCSERLDCRCTGKGNYCGSSFDKACGYFKSQIQVCERAGEDPLPGENCKLGCVDEEGGASVCSVNENPCACTKTGVVCGSKYPGDCNYDFAGLYTCAKVGELPEAGELCKKECLSTERDSTCDNSDPTQEPICLCVHPGQICGGAWGKSCGLDADTLYSCDGPSSTPEAAEKCTDGCDGTEFPGVCKGGKEVQPTPTASDGGKSTTPSDPGPSTTGGASASQEPNRPEGGSTLILEAPALVSSPAASSPAGATPVASSSEASSPAAPSTAVPTPTASSTDSPSPSASPTAVPDPPASSTDPPSPSASPTAVSDPPASSTDPPSPSASYTAVPDPPASSSEGSSPAETSSEATSSVAMSTAAASTTATDPTSAAASTTTAATSTSSAAPTLSCDTDIAKLKSKITSAFSQIDEFVTLLGEPLMSRTVALVATIKGYQNPMLAALSSSPGPTSMDIGVAAEELRSIITSNYAQFMAVGYPPAALKMLTNALGDLLPAAGGLNYCTNAAKTCSGVLIALGYLIKLEMPTAKVTWTGLPAEDSDKLFAAATVAADKLIAGPPSDGVSAANLLSDALEDDGSFLPGSAQLPSEILDSILDDYETCSSQL